MDDIVRGRIRSPREHDANIPKALAAICLKAVSVDPSDRYHSADEFIAELERWKADQPIQAQRETLTDRAARLTRKHRSAALAGAASLAVVAIVSTVAFLSVNQLRQIAKSDRDEAVKQQGEAEEQRQAAEDQRDLAQSFRYGTLLDRAFQKSRDKAWDESVAQTLHEWRSAPMRSDPRGWEWHYLNSVQVTPSFRLAGHRVGIRDFGFDASGRYLLSTGTNDPVRIWDVESGHEVQAVDLGGPNKLGQSSPNRRYLAVVRHIAAGKDVLILVDLETRQLRQLPLESSVCTLQWLSEDQLFVNLFDRGCFYVDFPEVQLGKSFTIDLEPQVPKVENIERRMAWTRDLEYCAFASILEILVIDADGKSIAQEDSRSCCFELGCRIASPVDYQPQRRCRTIGRVEWISEPTSFRNRCDIDRRRLGKPYS